MSLWGATVITNLLSAIPVFGQDLVELIWTLKLCIFICCSVGIIKFIYFAGLESIGKINWSKVRGVKPTTSEDSKRLLAIPISFLGKLAGIIDGDGYIRVVASDSLRKFASISLLITLIHTELPLLILIKDTLGIGRIVGPYKNPKGEDTISLIFNKTELQQVLFPLFIYHGIFFLTYDRRAQYAKAIFLMEQGWTKMYDLPLLSETIKSKFIFSLPNSPLGYLNLPFFTFWVVGFSISEGSFLIKSNLDACFQLKQRTHIDLFEAFRILFNTTRKITNDSNYSQFSVSSKKDIQTVINFFSCPGNTLLGNKLIQYNNWISNLKKSNRYGSLNFNDSPM